jgi:hypothetical protein
MGTTTDTRAPFLTRGSKAGMLVAAVIYFVTGIVSTEMAKGAGSHTGVVGWRLAAWAVSAFVFIAHVGFERVQRAASAVTTARHAALGAAAAACALAVVATLTHLAAGAEHTRRMGLAIVLWPAITWVAAFLVALAGAAVLGQRKRREG